MRHHISRALIAIACVLMAVGAAAGVANRQLLDGSRFAEHADAVRSDDSVSELLGLQLSTQVIELNPNLVALRPAIEAVTVALVRSSVFTPIVTAAVEQAHRALTEPDSGAVILRLADLSAVLSAALSALAPDIAAQLPDNLQVTLAEVGSQSFAGDTIRAAHLVGLLAWLLPLLAVVLLGAAVALAPVRLRALASCGAALVGAGVLVAVATCAAAIAVAGQDRGQLRGALIAAFWDQIRGSFWRAAILLVVAGVPIIAVAGGRLPSLSLRDLLAWGRARAAAMHPGPVAQGALAVASIALGALVVYRPAVALGVAASAVGVVLIAVGVGRVSQLAAQYATAQQQTGSRRRWGIPVLLVLALVVGLLPVAVQARPVDETIPVAQTGTGCNGHDELCGRAFNDVAYVSTHNSMSAANEPGWFIPQQPDSLVSQLDAGVRSLLIDTWYGQRTQGGSVTATAPGARAAALAEVEAEYGPEVVASALRLRGAVNLTPIGPIEPYLCHGLCELGSTPLLPALRGVAAWMGAHPREVVSMVLEDNISPEDTVAAFRQAGLLRYVHTQEPGAPWPTLQQMIDSNERLVVFSQRQPGGPSAPWLMQAFDWIQDTSYTNPTVQSLSCDRLRGNADSPLLLINHFLTRFDTRVTDSLAINAESVLLPYVERCELERGMLPNFVSVDFYNLGDVFDVVDSLNGFR